MPAVAFAIEAQTGQKVTVRGNTLTVHIDNRPVHLELVIREHTDPND